MVDKRQVGAFSPITTLLAAVFIVARPGLRLQFKLVIPPFDRGAKAQRPWGCFGCLGVCWEWLINLERPPQKAGESRCDFRAVVDLGIASYTAGHGLFCVLANIIRRFSLLGA